MEPDATPPAEGAPPAVEYCYRHPQEPTRVHCTRCGRPICPECMIEAPVGHHCPTCVAEARAAFRRSPAAQVRQLSRASGTKLLLYALGAVYLVEILLSRGDALTTSFGAITPRFGRTLFEMGSSSVGAIADGEWWRLVTAMFLHIGLLHLLMNAYALWIFGQFIEASLGRWRMIVLFLVTGFLASVTSYFFNVGGAGASGAISGLFGAFIAYNFRRRHTGMGYANLRMAGTLIILNAALAILVPNIDWRAHLGGLVAGVAAGTFAEGFGPHRWRRFVELAGLAALVALGIFLTAIHTADLRAAGV